MGFLLCLSAASGLACSVPVFRYALEMWHSDPYTVYLIHDGGTPQAVDGAEAFLAPYAKLNALDTIRADLSDPRVGSAIRKRKISPTEPLPRLVVTLPRNYSREPVVVFDAPLTTNNLRQVVDSPVRRELVRRLLSGDSAVWLLMESGDSQRDDAAEKRLRTELGKLEKEITLPEPEAEDMRKFDLSEDKLRIGFSVLRFARNDAAETLLVNSLLRASPDLDLSLRQPIAFPVFGRGRLLASFSEKELTADNIRNVTYFITGSCSCEIKESNPGMDLLLPVDWDRYIDNLIGFDASLPPLAGYARFVPPAPEESAACSTNAEPEAAGAAVESNPLQRNLMIAGGALLVVLGIFTGIILHKKGLQ